MDHLEEFRIPEEAIEKMQTPGYLEKCLAEGMTLQSILGFSNDVMEKFYQSACRMFQDGKYKEAEDAFIFLTTVNPNTFAFWLGLGMCHHYLEEYEQALMAYSCAANIDSPNPLPDYYAASCHVSLRNWQQSLLHIEDALKKCEGNELYIDLYNRCKMMHHKVKEKVK